MINDPVNNLQIKLLEGPDSLIDFALSKKFDERLSLTRSRSRVWKELKYQRIIRSQSVVQLPERLPKNGPLGFLEYYVPKAAIIFEVFFGAVGAGHLLCQPVRQHQSRLVKFSKTVAKLASPE
jgi:hypothetical protein